MIIGNEEEKGKYYRIDFNRMRNFHKRSSSKNYMLTKMEAVIR